MDRTICEVNGVLASANEGENGAMRFQRSIPASAQVYPVIVPRPAKSLQQLANQGPAEDTKSSNSPALANVEKYAAETLSEVKALGTSYRLVNLLLSWWSKRPPAPVKHDRKGALAWDNHKQRLAISDGADAVQVFDLSASVRNVSNADNLAPPAAMATLEQGGQKSVTSLEFRPHYPGMLATAGLEAVTLWDLHTVSQRYLAGQEAAFACLSLHTACSLHTLPLLPAAWGVHCNKISTRRVTLREGQSASIRKLGMSARSASSAASKVLVPERDCLLVDVAWSPDGRLLAAAHGDAPGFTVWDVATGTPTSISAGLSPIAHLKWSPDGSYLLAALPEKGFQLWETSRWKNVAFQTGSGRLVSASWHHSSKTVLLAFSSALQLTALYLIGPAYSLKAQLLPLNLPGFGPSQTNGSTGDTISCIEWDPQGDRLAVAYGEGHDNAGEVALYSTSCHPVVSVRLIGNISAGSTKKPVQTLSSHPNYQKGALLAMSQRRQIFVLPLIYTPGSS